MIVRIDFGFFRRAVTKTEQRIEAQFAVAEVLRALNAYAYR